MRYSMNIDNSSSNDTEDCLKVPKNECLSAINNSSKGSIEKNMKDLQVNKDLFVENLLDELDKLTQGEELNEKSEKHSTNETTTLNTENFEKILKTSVETKFVENDETVSLSENASLDTQVCHPSQDSELNHQEEIANMQKDHENEVNNLQIKLEQQKKENDIIRKQLNEQLSKLEIESSAKQQHYLKTIKSMENHIKVLRQERDEGVMRFAEAERKREEMRVSLEKGELIMKGWGREKEAALNRWKVVCDENKRAFDMCKNQKLEISELKKDIERLTDTMNKHENLARAANSKYQVEVDNHKETSRRLVENVRVVNEVRVESVGLHDIISSIFLTLQELNDRQQSQTPPSNTTTNATKIDYNNVLKVLQASKKDLNQLHWKQKEIVAEMLTYKDKIHCLEMEHQARTDELTELKELSVDHEEVTKLMSQLEETSNRTKEYESQLAEVGNEMESMRQRCEESLSCNQKLSQLNCSLQAQNHAYEKDLAELTEKNVALANFVSSLQIQASSLSKEKETLEKEKDDIIDDLAIQLQQTREKVKNLEVAYKDLNDDVKVMKKRYLSALRDLRKQLAGKEGHDCYSLHSSLSHAESSFSLDNLSNNLLPSSCNSCAHEGNDESKLLIENLQKELNKKNQSLEFLNDHVQKLTKELNSKTKKLRSMQAKKELYTLLQDLPEFHTQNFAKGQAEVGKMFKVMMEDTLTKNIELKESVKTLGEEIDRLTKEKKSLEEKLQDNLLVCIPDIQIPSDASNENTAIINYHCQNDQEHAASPDCTAVLDVNNNIESKPN